MRESYRTQLIKFVRNPINVITAPLLHVKTLYLSIIVILTSSLVIVCNNVFADNSPVSEGVNGTQNNASQSNQSYCLTPTPDDYSTSKIIPSESKGVIAGNTVPVVKEGNVSYTGSVPSSFILNLEVTFKIRNSNQFQKCLQSLSDPSSSNYHHFLNSDTIQPYLPTPGQKASIISYFSKIGFNVTEDPSPLVLKMSASVGTVEQALSIKIGFYNKFYAANTDPSLPANLADLLSGISGLDNYTVAAPAESSCSGPYCLQGIQIGSGYPSVPEFPFAGLVLFASITSMMVFYKFKIAK